MKYLTIAFLNLIISTGFTQISKSFDDYIEYQLYSSLSCENLTKKVEKYYLNAIINDSVHVFVSDSNGICRIPANETLKLNIHSFYGTNRTIIISNKNDIIDTITIAPIYKAPFNKSFTSGPTYYAWYNCGQICHGMHKSYRQNGQIWQKGRFKKGKLKKLITYYSNGIIESKNKDGFLVSYGILNDNSGKLIGKYKRIFFF